MSQPSLYLLGGPMRAGKSISAARFAARTGVAVVSTDEFIGMFQLAAPDLGIGHGIATSWRQNRQLVTPFVEAFGLLRARTRHPVLIEGEILPESAARLVAELGAEVRACFVGSCGVGIETTEAAIAGYSRANTDWLAGSTPERFHAVALDVQQASREYQDAAKDIGIPYFDMQPDFEASVERVVRYLSGLS